VTPVFPSATLSESALFNAVQVLPNTLTGLFRKRENLVGMFDGLDTDLLAAQVLADLRAAHPGDALWVRVLGVRTLLVFGEPLLREVLDRSGSLFASDPDTKLQGMSHFQPGALTLSHGEKWRERRAHAHDALSSGPLAPHFLSLVAKEIARLKERSTAYVLDWPSFEDAVTRIARQVILGTRARDDDELTAHLRAMMSEANRVKGLRRSRHYEPFYRRLAHYVRVGEPGSLVSQLRSPDPSQVTHWLFAMADTVAANAFRALAATVNQPSVLADVRASLRAPTSVSDVDGMGALERCVHETMRLWPTTPMFGRRTTAATTLGGVPLPGGTQLLIVNSFNHRDPRSIDDPDLFTPDRWRDARPDYRFNQFSNGTQGCPGSSLSVFLMKAVLANLLVDCSFTPLVAAAQKPLPLKGKLGMAATAATNTATMPWRAFASGRFTMRQLEKIAYDPVKAMPQLTMLLKALPLTMTFADPRAGQRRIVEGRPMPYSLNYFTLRFAMEPLRV